MQQTLWLLFFYIFVPLDELGGEFSVSGQE